MIYSFIGQPSSGKTTLARKLHNFLKTDKRNWRDTVFHLDAEEFRELSKNRDYSESGRRTNIKNVQVIIEYLHNNGCDVVVSFINPYIDLREDFKDRFNGDFTEIYTHCSEKRERDDYHVSNFEHPEINFIDVDTTKDSPEISFSKLINHLYKLDKL